MAEHVERELWELAGGALAPERREGVEAHLAWCERCRGRLAAVRSARNLLDVAAAAPPPVVSWQRVTENLDAALRRRERVRRWRRWALAAALPAAMALAFLGGRMLRPAAGAAPRIAQLPARPQPPTLAPPSVPPAPPPAAEIAIESSGGVVFAREGAVRGGARLRPGAELRTGPRSKAVLRLPEGSRVELAAESELLLRAASAGEVVLSVAEGRIAVEASHVARQAFRVEAGRVTVTVTGTVFGVTERQGRVRVFVGEGSVAVDWGGPPRAVRAGQALSIDAAGRARPSALRPEECEMLAALSPRVLPVRAQPPPAARAPISPPVAPAADAPGPPPAPEASQAAAAPVPTEQPGAQADRPQAEVAAPQPEVAAAPEVAEPQMAPQSLEPWPQADPPSAPFAESSVELPWDRDGMFARAALDALHNGTCGLYVVGLVIIADRGQDPSSRGYARILLARCYSGVDHGLSAGEYRRYLREFPQGPFAQEAQRSLHR